MVNKRIKKKIVFYAHPNINQALRKFCEDNNVFASEVLALLLSEFLYNAKTSSPEIKELIRRTQKEDMLTSRFSSKKSNMNENEDLMKLVRKHLSDSAFVERVLSSQFDIDHTHIKIQVENNNI